MGRRSLLLRQSAASHWSLELTSVSCGPLNNPGGEFREISARAIYQLYLDRLDGSRVALDSIIEHLDEDLNSSTPRQVLNARKMVQIHERSNRDAFVRVELDLLAGNILMASPVCSTHAEPRFYGPAE